MAGVAIEMGDMSGYQAGAASNGNQKEEWEAEWRAKMRKSMPAEYHDALLDDDYMENLIKATEHFTQNREVAFRRYELLNKIILIALIVQAVLGVFIAIWKTLLQPEVVFSATANLDNVKMVLMADSSRHSGEEVNGYDSKRAQHDAILSLSRYLWDEIDKKKQIETEELLRMLREKQDKESSSLFKLIAPERGESAATMYGGYLYIAMGLFNSVEQEPVHPFTHSFDKHKMKVDQIDGNVYQKTAEYKRAMQQCIEIIEHNDGKVGKPDIEQQKYCVIIGDSQAQCQKQKDTEMEDALDSVPGMRDMFPDDYDDSSLSESAEEFKECTDYVLTEFPKHDLQLIFVFLVPTYEMEQQSLTNPVFRNFVERSTGCEITKGSDIISLPTGDKVVPKWIPDENCPKFIVARDYDTLPEKARQIAELLDISPDFIPEPNEKKDWRFLCFLLLPLNLLFFIVWGRIIVYVNQAWHKYLAARGVTKKMVKVSKRLVEKSQGRTSVFDRLDGTLTDVEKAELLRSRQIVKFNSPMTLRCRLKGGYLRRNDGGTRGAIEDDVADGIGNAFDDNCNWTFEPVEEGPSTAQGVLKNQEVRVKNNKGQYLYANQDRTGFMEGDPTGDPSTVFAVEPVEHSDDDFNRLGDVIGLRAVNSPDRKYMRVTKEGKSDANGGRSAPDVQLVIDQGGPVIRDQTTVILKSNAADQALLLGTPDGDLALYNKEQDGTGEKEQEDPVWSNFHIKKVGRDCEKGGMFSKDFPATPVGQPLQARDIVTLRGFNQNMLKCYDGTDEKCGCGRRPGFSSGAASSTESSAPPEGPVVDSAPGETRWVVERIGMGVLKGKQDETLRKGMEIALKPYRDKSDRGPNTNVKLNEDGTFAADGQVTSAEVVFTIDPASVYDMVSPLANVMMNGDIDLQICPLWDKRNVKHYQALSAPWLDDDDLAAIHGHVVVADESGTYTVPKQRGQEDFGWVAVVNDNVNIHKAAALAKSQGANGLIIRTDGVFSLEKMAQIGVAGEGEEGPPVLPTMFVDKEVGTALDEKGITVKGGEFHRKHMTEAMRVLGKCATNPKDYKNIGDVHGAFGRACLRHMEEEKQRLMEEVIVEETVMEDDSQKFKWKVNTNVNYFRGNAHVKVSYGKKAPPSARKAKFTTCAKTGKLVEAGPDASGAIAPRRSKIGRLERRTTFVEADKFAAKMQMGSDLNEVLNVEDADPGQLEQLSEESDWRLEYQFEEIEVAVGEKVEDLQEDVEVQDHEGSVVKAVGVPIRHFWIMALGLFIASVSMLVLLHNLMQEEVGHKSDADHTAYVEPDEFWVVPPATVAELASRTDFGGKSGKFLVPTEPVYDLRDHALYK